MNMLDLYSETENYFYMVVVEKDDGSMTVLHHSGPKTQKVAFTKEEAEGWKRIEDKINPNGKSFVVSFYVDPDREMVWPEPCQEVFNKFSKT